MKDLECKELCEAYDRETEGEKSRNTRGGSGAVSSGKLHTRDFDLLVHISASIILAL